MSWVSLVLALVKMAVAVQTWINSRQMMQAGQDRAVANAALDLLEQTKVGKELRERIAAMDDPEAEALWRRMTENE